MIRTIEDFTNIELYDEMVRNGEDKQSEEELSAIIDEYNKNAGIFKKKSKKMLLKAYNMNWKMSEKRYADELRITIHEENAEKHKAEFKQSVNDFNDAIVDFKQSNSEIKNELKRANSEIKNDLKQSGSEIKKELKRASFEIKNDFKQSNSEIKNDFKQSSSEKNDLIKQKVEKEKLEKEMKLEEKFGVQFQNRTWFECTIEEMRFSTVSNANNRDVQRAYVFVEPTFLEIIKESVFLKSKMGARKIYFENIASIDYDARGKLHLTNNLIINLKSSEHIQLKNILENWAKLITDKYEQYLFNKNNNVQSQESGNDVDDLMKYAELLEKGLITKEEFDMKKAEVMGISAVSESDVSAKFCSNCGNPIKLDSKFCPNCGNQL